VSEVLEPGDTAIDATMGNGYDTLFLASRVGNFGKVYAIDIQPIALENTRQRLFSQGMEKHVSLVLGSHENLSDLVPVRVIGHTKTIMFNLGYLPRGDKKTKTSVITTLAALKTAVKIIAVSGRITIVAYTGHCGGKEEAEAVKAFGKSLSNNRYQFSMEIPKTRGRNVPWLMVIEKK